LAEFAGFAARRFRRIIGVAVAEFDGRANVAAARMIQACKPSCWNDEPRYNAIGCAWHLTRAAADEAVGRRLPRKRRARRLHRRSTLGA
jgi:hypothetical protein